MIVGQNALLNQYVPTFYIKDLMDGQTVRYDSVRKAFVNAEGGGGGGVDRLGELIDVSDQVDNPLSLQNGQVLTYNSFTQLWENKLIGGGTGTAGQVLTSDGSGSPIWTTPASTSVILTGDVTGTGTGTVPTVLATVNSNVGTFGNGTNVPQITVDAKGRITGVVNVPISESGIGTVTNVSGTGTQGVTVNVTNPTSTPNITVGLGAITPTSVAATGTVTGSNLSGTNTGDQTIILSGDATGSGTGAITLTLATVNVTPGTYGDSHFVPTLTVNSKGLVTSVTTQHVDTTVRDLVDTADNIVVAARHQYIVTTELEVDGLIENNGVIAIL